MELNNTTSDTVTKAAIKSDVQLLMSDNTLEGITRKKEFTKEQELMIRRIFNGMWPILFPYTPFSPLKVAGNIWSHNDLRNEPFFIEIKSTSNEGILTYGFSFDADKLKKMVNQALLAYAKDGIKKDILFVLQFLQSKTKFRLYLFNLTRDFDLKSLQIEPFNHSESDWPWTGKERIYIDKGHLEKFGNKTYKLKMSQGKLIFDNIYEISAENGSGKN